ncbi:hypothetical protein [Agitococcus lubricus]|uniref:Uncharacterized protein n=1 Tax=Agitococcus lubricus TaxID=1077255 RepID=A0A2T5IW89_9GAMM|nr:hypothetical protein [Agitococcus lubricus]PTQ88177.1 hypothetical protein C8N29_11437 [Agitococcus lubricus]
MMKSVLLCSCLVISSISVAADKAATTKKPAKASSSDVDIKFGTDVIGSQDAPLELNLVPWKDKENYLPKNPITASVLQETLEPIDRDVVSREVNFARALQELSTIKTP